MDLQRTFVLGLIAGSTIIFGLPIGRVRRPGEVLRVLLTASSVGVLLFLVWDVLSAAWQPVDEALAAVHDHTGSLAPVFTYGALFAGGITAGLLCLVGYGQHMQFRGGRRFGPGAMAVAEARHTRRGNWSTARRTALMIAVGIGLHNFAEGLAIGQSAARNETALAALLVIGFGLHNATEGFGIVAPLAADTVEPGADGRPSWAFLLTMGVVAGGPTVVGAVVGHGVNNQAISVGFLTLAAGSILYVVLQLITVLAKARRMDLIAYGALLGLLAGFVTDAIVTAAGA